MSDKHKKTFEGKVVSKKMDKVAVVELSTFKLHPLYRKRIAWSKKYFVRDEKNECKLGDTVEFSPSKAFSAKTNFSLEKVLASA